MAIGYGVLEFFEMRRRYYEALGEFITQFAWIEATIQIVLWRIAKTPVPTARALFSGTRVDGASGFIRRLLLVHPMDQKKKTALENVLDQLGHINSARNQIIHFGATPVPEKIDEWVSSNSWIALTERHMKDMPVSPEILGCMTHDLRRIERHFIVHHFDREHGLPPPFSDDEMAELDAPWRYKPVQPAPPAEGRQKKPARRKRQR